MADTLELPKELVDRVRHYAAASGHSPAEWLDRVVPPLPPPPPGPDGPQTLYDQIKDLIGQTAGTPLDQLKEDPNDPFFNILLRKKRDGHL